jgi:hypothetical protein
MAPERLTGEISRFVDECWRPVKAGSSGTRVSA